MSTLYALQQLGQSIWYDNIRRGLLDSGELAALIEAGIAGVTSNPTIFQKAIAGGDDYDAALSRLVKAGYTAAQIYEALALEDVARTADLLWPVYERTDGWDGFVSLEVSPVLAHDTENTIAEARRLFQMLGRPNVMIKVPATAAGIPAVERLIAAGVNVNATLLFSLEQYEAVAQAYVAGLERRAAAGGDLRPVAGVASFFVSRVDTAVDRVLETVTGGKALQGKIAIANSKCVYARFSEIFRGARWGRLVVQGARVQRPLWASTGTKNPHYSDTLYVDSLIGPNTVNTLPPATLQAFMDHGAAAPTLKAGLDEAHAQLARLAELGVNLDEITRRLLEEGVAAFAASFDALLAGIARRRERLLSGNPPRSARLGAYQEAVDRALRRMEVDGVIGRLWARDHTLWKPDPAGITNRLGWLHSAEAMCGRLERIAGLANAVRAEGYTSAVLLGMGGSSLAPEVFRKTFGVQAGYLDLVVLDSTDPGAIAALAGRLDPAHTLFIVATKSGGTVETLSFFKYFYNWLAGRVGTAHTGAHFVAITDPGSRLAELAERLQFRETFLNDPEIGGRYSALSYFGLVPAALVGMDLARLLENALAATAGCQSHVPAQENPGLWLGALLGELARAGRDKLTLVLSPGIASFGDWVEQLVAESTGKEGLGILPVVGEPPGAPAVYAGDRLFVYVRLEGDGTHDAAVQALEDTGQPVVRLDLPDRYSLGAQMFIWALATAVASHRLGISPFDQPNVEAAKVLARQMVAAYKEKGALPAGEAAAPSAAALAALLGQAPSYVALQAYVQPSPETDAALQALQVRIRDGYRLATTVGYGPRFLHSTGQLHKGDGGNGLFVQFTADAAQDLPIPDEAGAPASSISFGVLELAQALGDLAALQDAGRRVVRFHLGTDVPGGLRRLVEEMG